MAIFHKNLIESVYQCLSDIFSGGFYADKVIEKKFKENKNFGARDRAFIAENTYDIVRNYRILYEILGKQPSTREEWIQLILIHIFIKTGELVFFQEFPKIDTSVISSKLEEVCKTRAVKYSFPDWLDKLCADELGEKLWNETCEELSKKAKVVIRANSLKTTPADLQKILATENIIATPFKGEALIIEGKTNLFRTKAFQDGLFEMQDYSSQKVAHFMQIKPNMRVIDACAGAGGKTLHIAALLNNKSKVVALDNDSKKLDQLRLRARRAGCSNVESRHIENSKTIKRLENSAERLLLDVPCSGLGVLKRNPDSKWKLSPESIENVKNIQAEILDTYHTMLKSAGLLIYSTCSILPSENENQIKKFLEKYSDKFELIEEHKIFPQSEGFDGFYCAVIKKI